MNVGPDLTTSGAPQVKTQLKQQKARAQRTGQQQTREVETFEDDEESEDLTEEQKKAKRIIDLKKKHTFVFELDKKKKAPPKKSNQTYGKPQDKDENLDDSYSFNDQSDENFVAPEIIFSQTSFKEPSIDKKSNTISS